eukprot:CAMPEP_0171434232 /NCGR_PEP_ID=MMETSP0881-20121228/9104_1 /TAXON_ID=67004 /ORGANISM="Thalassiosira weissflogii, Strain CCMP1336" /LENGTH=63 /DNA_ID=CAMNT_0011954897 /DNA_START=75 /DNA_END=263 /DNA_ORIENTATION=+
MKILLIVVAAILSASSNIYAQGALTGTEPLPQTDSLSTDHPFVRDIVWDRSAQQRQLSHKSSK